MVVNSLAAILPDGDQLPHLCACMESARSRSFDTRFPRQTLTQRGYRRDEVGAPGTGGLDHVVLAQWVCGAGRVFEWQDMLWYGM